MTNMMGECVPNERLIRKQGLWTHDLDDFKKLWPFLDDRVLLCSSKCVSDCYEERILQENQHTFSGARIFALDSSGGRASAFALSPPVKRAALGDVDASLQCFASEMDQLDQPWDGSHVVAFASAGHALKPHYRNVLISAEVFVGQYVPARTWKKGVHLLARNLEPAWPKISLKEQVSPPVKQKRDDSNLLPVKPTASSKKIVEPDLLFGAVSVGVDCYGDVWPHRCIEPHDKPWWYVPTSDLPDPESDTLLYCLSYPGEVEEDEMDTKYGVVDGKKASLLLASLNQSALVPHRMSISVGDAIGANSYVLKFRASTTRGSSGGPVASFNEPLKLYGVHIRGNFDYRLSSDMESNYNICTSVNHPLWVLNYVKTVLPILSHVKEWPCAYMQKTLLEYLEYHKTLIQDNDMWHAVENFKSCHAVDA